MRLCLECTGRGSQSAGERAGSNVNHCKDIGFENLASLGQNLILTDVLFQVRTPAGKGAAFEV